MARTRFLVDKNIPFAEEALRPLGDVTLLPGAAIDAAAVREVDVLWVRSTLRVNAELLAGSPVRFVGTATIGTDHVDTEWLDAQRIAWASAPGSNAPSVALWWAAALATACLRRGVALRSLQVGIVGVGNVGRRIEAFASALGCAVLRCDPPRARTEGPTGFVTLEELCRWSDVLTLHVPLELSGLDSTLHLVDAQRLAELRDNAIVVNCSRGAVLDGAALLQARAARSFTALLDVYEGEPVVPPSLVEVADLATPHIAGHSIDGKAAGTKMIYDATCAHLGARSTWTPRRALPPLPVTNLAVETLRLPDEEVLLKVLRRFYRIEEDDAAMRRIALLPDEDRGAAFQRFRSSYPPRREPAGVNVELMPPRPTVAAALATLGVRIVEH